MNNTKQAGIYEELPREVEASRDIAADEYLHYLQTETPIVTRVAVEKMVSFRTGFKYGYHYAIAIQEQRISSEKNP